LQAVFLFFITKHILLWQNQQIIKVENEEEYRMSTGRGKKSKIKGLVKKLICTCRILTMDNEQ
jgi:hypothetical protein